MLVITPKKINRRIWCNEAAKWEQLSHLKLSDLMINKIPVVLNKTVQKCYTELEHEALIEIDEQTADRLYRQGQLYPVFVHLLVVKGGRDEDVILSLNDKSKAQDYAMNTLKARIHKVKEVAA